MGYVVTGAAAVVSNQQGKTTYYYQGAAVPDDAANLEHLLEVGLIADPHLEHLLEVGLIADPTADRPGPSAAEDAKTVAAKTPAKNT